jgi:hypothetical protein
MKRSILLLCCFLFAGTAEAGLYSDDMARCLVASTSPKDKTILVRWIFAISSLHPDVADISRISAAGRVELDRSVAALFERLVTDSCRKQSAAAIRYEGAMAFQQSFGVLGQVAMQELMTNKNVGAGVQGFIKYMDKAKIEALKGE